MNGAPITTLLVIEDNPGDARVLREMFEEGVSRTSTMIQVGSMADAERHLAGHSVDVILLDLGLPDAQGLAAVERAHAAAAHIPLVILTGLDDERIATQALHIGAQDYLLKGQIDARGLSRALRYAVERSRLEDQLRQAQKMEAIGQLAGGVAHDFNNLLTVILGHSNHLVEELSDRDPLRESAEEIRDAGDRAAAMTMHLLAFSRRLVLAPALLDLNQLVTNVERLLGRMIGEDVSLATVVSAEIGVVLADAGQIEQVLMNLAVNARDAMPDGGTLTITVDEARVSSRDEADAKDLAIGDYVTIVVADSGTGMSAETQTHLFEPFYTTKSVDKGTGLGLATSYGIVKQSGGNITVDSTLGAGATFTIYLPRLDAQAATLTPLPALVERPVATETLLLVEDEPAVRRLTRRMLENRGYRVIEASAGAEALVTARGHDGPIALLLTDVVMPGMGGRELAALLADERPETRVVYMSGYPDDAVLRLDLGQVVFVQKPFTAEGLAAKLREAVA